MSFDGTWAVVMESPMGNRELTLRCAADGSALTGTIDFGGNPAPLVDGSVAGDTVSWKAEIRGNAAEFTGTVDGDTVTGQVKLDRGSLPFSGKRSG